MAVAFSWLCCVGGATPARANAELFAPTDVTARYDARHALKTWWSGTPDYSQLEPASGPAHEPQEHSAHATGKSEGKKSFSGKIIGAVPEIPSVTIAGQSIISHAAKTAIEISDTIPAGLDNGLFLPMLDRRYKVSAYAHSPRRGPSNAQIEVVLFTDFSCGQCMPELIKIDAALAAVSETVQVVHVHAPMVRFQDTNMPAFYGKIAARGGVFWDYRSKLMANPTEDANTLFDILLASGLDTAQARNLMLTEARRFYRELDADTLLARSFSVGNPPVAFVNGIRVGQGGIPLDKMGDVLAYISKRFSYGMAEPPK